METLCWTWLQPNLMSTPNWGLFAFKICLARTTGTMEWPESRNARKPEKTGKAGMTRIVTVLIYWCNDAPCAFIGNADRICCANYLQVYFAELVFLHRRALPIGAKCLGAPIILHIMSESDLSNVCRLMTQKSPSNSAQIGPKWHSLRSVQFQVPKKSRFQGPPLPMAHVMDLPASKSLRTVPCKQLCAFRSHENW